MGNAYGARSLRAIPAVSDSAHRAVGEGVGGVAADLDGVDAEQRVVVEVADLRDRAEHREQAGEGDDGERVGEVAGLVAEVDGELVDGGVEGLEGDRLALGAVAGEGEGVVLAADQVDDVLDENQTLSAAGCVKKRE